MSILLSKETKRKEFKDSMKENGIRTRIRYPLIHTFMSYKNDMIWDLSLTEDVVKREITLPLYPAISNDVVVVVSPLRQA